MLKHLTLIGAAMLVTSATAASAQVRNCTACETAIKDKLAELDNRTSRTNLLVKTVDRKLDPLVVKVDAIDTKLTAVQTKLDELARGASSKAAVVVEFGSGLKRPQGNSHANVDQLAANFCHGINYRTGIALEVGSTGQYDSPANAKFVLKLICFD